MKMKKFALRGLMILAVVVALCIFFSGTVRTLTTPKVRFAQVKNGRMEQEISLTGKVVFPETEEFSIAVPEGATLTVTRVHVTSGQQVKAGETLISAKLTDGEKTLESLRKESAAAQKELKALEKKMGDVRLTRGEQQWQAAWEAESSAREAAREAKVNLLAAMAGAGLEMKDGALPEGAGEEIIALDAAWREKEEILAGAEKTLAGLERYAIADDLWTSMQQKQEYEEKIAEAEEKMTALQALSKTAEKITAPHAGYISEISIEKGATIDGDTVILKMTPEGKDPVIRVDLSEVKQEVSPGANLTLMSDSWSNPVVKVVNTGLTIEGRPYADAEITKDAIYAMGNVSTMMKNDIKAKLIIRSQDSTCLVPASAIRGSGDSRYVYIANTENSTFGGSKMTVQKMNVTVLAESGTTVSVSEDLSYLKVLYMEDRALTEGGTVMEYTKD